MNAKPVSTQLVIYTRPTADANGPLRQFAFDADGDTVNTARSLEMALKNGQPVDGDSRGYFAEKGSVAPPAVQGFNDAVKAAGPALLKVEGNVEPGMIELLGMVLVQPDGLKEFLKEFPQGTVAIGVNHADKGLGYFGALDTAPQAIKDVVAAAELLRPALPKIAE